jgi:aspartate carbamoyltransferase regulatory subunit
MLDTYLMKKSSSNMKLFVINMAKCKQSSILVSKQNVNIFPLIAKKQQKQKMVHTCKYCQKHLTGSYNRTLKNEKLL